MKILIFHYFLLIQSVFSSIVNELCISSEPECIQSLKNNNSAICEEIKCDSKRPVECGPHFCTINKRVCELFILINEAKMLIKTDRFKKSISQSTNKRYIAQCSKITSVELQTNNFCNNEQNCSHLQSSIYLNRHFKGLKCVTCHGLYAFKCGQNLCTSNKKDCKKLINAIHGSKIKENFINKLNIKKCF